MDDSDIDRRQKIIALMAQTSDYWKPDQETAPTAPALARGFLIKRLADGSHGRLLYFFYCLYREDHRKIFAGPLSMSVFSFAYPISF